MGINFLKFIDRFTIEEVFIELGNMHELRDISPSKRIAFHSFSVRQTGLKVVISTVFLSIPDFYTMAFGVGKGMQFETLIEIHSKDSDEGVFSSNSLKNIIQSLIEDQPTSRRTHLSLEFKHRTYDEALLFHNAALDKLLSMSNESISEVLRVISDETGCLDSYYRDIRLNINSDFIEQLFPTQRFDHIRLLD